MGLLSNVPSATAFVLLFIFVFPSCDADEASLHKEGAPKLTAATILDALDNAAKEESVHGDLIATTFGELWTGISETKMDQLHEEAQRELDALIARSEEARRKAVELLANLLSVKPSAVAYGFTSRCSYDNSIPIEIYYVNGDQFEMNAITNAIIQYGPMPHRETEYLPVRHDGRPLTSEQLEERARAIIETHAGSAALEGLDPRHSDKEGIAYFFRWEALGSVLEVGMRPFIQVGLAPDGSVLSYANTVNLVGVSSAPEKGEADLVVGPLSGVYIYANGGRYYTRYGPSYGWFQRNNEGYCGHLSVCAPAYMEWTYGTECIGQVNYAVWTNLVSDTQNGTHKVFVPRVNATTARATYLINYNIASSRTAIVDQSAYSDVWLQTARLYGIRKTWLSDSTCEGTPPRKVGFDEIQIAY